MRTSSGSFFLLVLLCLQSSASGRSIRGLKSRAPPNDALVQQWRDASWIWLSDGLDLEVPSGDWVFRTTYSPRSGVSVVTANVLITTDDYFTLYVNGQQIGGTRSPANDGQTVWAAAQGYSITVNSAPVVFAVIATNRGDPSGTAAGLLFAAQLTLSDGSSASVSTGRNNWRATQGIPQNFEATNINDSGWSSTAIIEKNAGNAPWGTVSLPSDLTSVSLRVQAPPPSPNTSPNTPTTTNAAPGQNPPNPQTTAPNVVTSVAIVTGTNGRISTSTSTSTRTAVSGLDGTTRVAPPPTTATSTESVRSTATSGTSTSDTIAIATNINGNTSTTPVGAIAGGTVGGFICLLLLIAAILLCLRGRRRRNQESAEALAALHADEMRTVATMSPSSGIPFSSAPSPTPFGSPNRRLEPFMLQARNDDGLRSKMYHDQKTSDTTGTHERSPSSSSGVTRTTGEVNVTMDRLQELAEELNRGLAERGSDTPRLMVVSARDAQMMNTQPGIESVQERMRDSVPLPPYEGRQES